MKEAIKPEEFQFIGDLESFLTDDLKAFDESDLEYFTEEELKAMIWAE